MPAAPTLEGFERRLRRTLLDRVKRVRLRAYWGQAAGIEWEGDDITTLWVEPCQRGIGWAVVHELAHYVRKHKMEDEGELEEPQIEGLATEVWKRIELSRRRYKWWREHIWERLAKGDL